MPDHAPEMRPVELPSGELVLLQTWANLRVGDVIPWETDMATILQAVTREVLELRFRVKALEDARGDDG